LSVPDECHEEQRGGRGISAPTPNRTIRLEQNGWRNDQSRPFQPDGHRRLLIANLSPPMRPAEASATSGFAKHNTT
jgi:hypothetical protein